MKTVRSRFGIDGSVLGAHTRRLTTCHETGPYRTRGQCYSPAETVRPSSHCPSRCDLRSSLLRSNVEGEQNGGPRRRFTGLAPGENCREVYTRAVRFIFFPSLIRHEASSSYRCARFPSSSTASSLAHHEARSITTIRRRGSANL